MPGLGGIVARCPLKQPVACQVLQTLPRSLLSVNEECGPLQDTADGELAASDREESRWLPRGGFPPSHRSFCHFDLSSQGPFYRARTLKIWELRCNYTKAHNHAISFTARMSSCAPFSSLLSGLLLGVVKGMHACVAFILIANI